MQYLRTFFLTLLVTVFVNCSKSNGNSDNYPADAPSNITITYVVSPDNSGNVSFTASATNAVNFEYDFGNGYFATSSSGSAIYKYPVSGTYTVNVTAKSNSGKSATKSVQLVISTVTSLIWSDEFNTAGAPDPAKWGYDIGTGSGGWGNNESEYYTNRSDNVTVSDGTLKIKAQKESYNGSGYTSARLLSKGKFSFKYGKIEVRAKLPAGGGTWPAIWMLGDNSSTVAWPACGEIDIMEHKGNDLNKIYGTFHYPEHSGANGMGGNVVITNATTEFHIYSLDWTASKIQIAVDGNVFYTLNNLSSLPFNQNFFAILNLAVGGNFAGAVDPNFTSGVMEVDYVRVYQ
ncbi:Beta-glucanase precursor [Arcticibacter svalbardensis MN12-7]|uniref:Beta-glucanase n=2 Tax=Arcticibacter TaxID=1288026 RepID=R9H2K0_9SPHI|nr:Beta-glucanase precursor [Arcticibacter svalbardensis MN12-7]